MTLVITGLERHHDRDDFDCGELALNTFLQRFARQQAQRNFNRTYVAVNDGEARIHGYYAISSASIDFENWPEGLRLPRYPVPIARIGRLAVDNREQGKGEGKGTGAALLRHAMHLTASMAQQIGVYALVVDAKHETAAAFYARYGFQRFLRLELSLYLTTDVIRASFAAEVPGPDA